MKKLASILLALIMVCTLALGTTAAAKSAASTDSAANAKASNAKTSASTATSKATATAKTYPVETIDKNTRYPTDAIIYKPKGVNPKVGVMFYAGLPVDYRDYGTLLKKIAARGYLVISVEFPFDMAALNVIAGEEYIKQYPEIGEWFLMGHSHGGGVACVETARKPDLFQGLILLDSVATVLPLPDDYPVLSFHATEDESVPLYQHKILQAELANTDMTEVIIEGGNHAQFGDYGIQSNDGTATISKPKQISIALKAILQFLAKYE